MCGVQTRSAADVARELDIHWVVHRIVQDHLDYREMCTLGAKESHRWWQSSLYGTVEAFILSTWHVILIKASTFGAGTWLITEKGCVIEKLSSPYSKENGSIVISKDGMEDFLGTIYMCLFWIPLTMMILTVDCYCGTLSLRQPFFAKGLGYFAKVLSFCMKMPCVIHPTGQLFMAVHLIGYGSVPVLCLVFYLSLNPWEAPGWQVIAIDADVKQVATSWLQTLNNIGTIWGRCQDGSGDCIEVWCVPSASHVPCIDQSQ